MIEKSYREKQKDKEEGISENGKRQWMLPI